MTRGAVSAVPHVFVATPTYSGNFCPQYVDSLEKTANALAALGWKSSTSIVKGDCYVQRARNTLVAEFMKTDATDLFFLDDDLGWPAEAFIKLVQMPDPVVFGVYPLKKDEEGYPVVIHTDENGVPMGRADGCIHASGAPTGFLRIKRHVIEMMQAAYPELAYDDGGQTVYDLFPQGVKNGIWWGEDFAFCNLWTALGGFIWCVPDIDFVHVGKKVYSGNYHKFLLGK